MCLKDLSKEVALLVSVMRIFEEQMTCVMALQKEKHLAHYVICPVVLQHPRRKINVKVCKTSINTFINPEGQLKRTQRQRRNNIYAIYLVKRNLL